MKRSITKAAFAVLPLGSIVAAALMVVPATVSAIPPEDRPASYAALVKMKPMEAMHAMDEGNKGYVTKEEFMKFMEALYDKMDRNHDGKVSKEEWLRGGGPGR